ncbi:MAG TPA: hypothetical protein VLZ74_16765 [Methylocella sp.]|nr:hypothetical protein [Methylocella sp.]
MKSKTRGQDIKTGNRVSGLEELLEVLNPVREDITKRIVRAVNMDANVDLAALGASLASFKASRVTPGATSSSSKIPPFKLKRHANTIKSHAERLIQEIDIFAEFLFPCSDVDKRKMIVTGLRTYLDDLARRADRIILEAQRGIERSKALKTPLQRSPSTYNSLFSGPGQSKTVSWLIAWELAPIYEAHFHKPATASTPPQTSGDRTPRGPFVRFVQAVQENLNVFPDQGSISAHTISTALAETKSERVAWKKTREDFKARMAEFLQGER